MAWIQSLFSGQNPAMTLVWLFLALAVLLIASFWLFRKIVGGGSLKTNRNRQPRLSVTDAAIVDEKRRLVLVRRDNVEHLVMIGGLTDFVIEQNIVRTQTVGVANRETVIAEAAPVTKPADTQVQASRTATPPRRQPAEAARSETASHGKANGAAVAINSDAPTMRAVEDTPVAAIEIPRLAVPELASFEFDLAGELERDLMAEQTTNGTGTHQAGTVANEPEEIDFAKLLGEAEPVAANTPVSAAAPPRARKQNKSDDEMQRLLDELANA